jgi:hypothetical protein
MKTMSRATTVVSRTLSVCAAIAGASFAETVKNIVLVHGVAVEGAAGQGLGVAAEVAEEVDLGGARRHGVSPFR